MTIKSLVVLCASVLVLGLAGCNTEREPGAGNKAVLKAGQQVSADMVGWVAVPNTEPKVAKGGDVEYAVLASQNVVPGALDGWVAINPALFSKMSDIKTETPNVAAAEKWVLKPEGKRVPKEMNGWVAVPPSSVSVEASARSEELKMAKLATYNIVPKELNGWVAVSPATLSKLSEKYMMTGKGSDPKQPRKLEK